MNLGLALIIILSVFTALSVILAIPLCYYSVELRWHRAAQRTLEGQLERGEAQGEAGASRNAPETIVLQQLPPAHIAGSAAPPTSREHEREHEHESDDEFSDIELSVSELAPAVQTAHAVPLTHVQSPTDAVPKTPGLGREGTQNSPEPLTVREIELGSQSDTPAAARA